MSQPVENVKMSGKTQANTSSSIFMYLGCTVMVLGLASLILGGGITGGLVLLSGAVLYVGTTITEAIRTK
ncbi:hypothetical protein ACX5K5_03145 [Glutamicibacter bergerei]|jgi:hypothetical protein|uniref:Secreted protein n=2 Tax=Glutamicibacter TaxID=1742989 RepID=A0ABV9MQ53_9MICC|nr:MULTISPECIES: hypothetical protein [Glutamicibacter]PCC31763.1 hypothetical protein CIK74_16515 [Glutamicibacter sp. BW77]GGJ53733.1 hypothetical protein GCM10007173_10320 [Glutamicibacter ardleyensis]HAY43769.1 hypothetical protein [Micrococcaceae bacterium]